MESEDPTCWEGWSSRPQRRVAPACLSRPQLLTLGAIAVQHLPTWRSRTYVITGLLTTAVAVAFSGLYLGYHWVSDVLGSWTLATLWLATVITADRLLAERNGRRVADRVGDAPADHVYVP